MTDKQNIEVELKFPLKNKDELIRNLDAKAKSVAKNVFQKDTYFIPPHRNFLDPKYPFEWLRLRETKNKASLNYKHFYPENTEKTDYCDEFQSDVHDVQAIKKMFESLDFKEIVVVEKQRSVWNYKHVEIAIDDVKGLGFFIELEAKHKFNDPKEAKEFLYSVLSDLNIEVGEEELRGYPFMVLRS